MRLLKRWLWLWCGLLLLAPAPILAQAGNPYQLSGNLASGAAGGGGGYEIVGTIGQGSAGETQGGGYSVALGFWGGGEAATMPRPDWAANANTICLPVLTM